MNIITKCHKRKRVEYIDALRGFTMLLVIYSHIITWSYGVESSFLYNEYFVKFRMPLFFFISGWVLYKRDIIWDFSYVLSFLKKKFMVQILPTAFFMIVFLYLTNSLKKETFGGLKSGYWFTLSLFQYFVIYALSRFAVHRWIKSKWVEDMSIMIISLLIFILSFTYGVLTKAFSLDTMTLEYIGCFQLRFYFFFCVGTFLKKYYDRFVILTDSHYFMTIVLGGAILMILFSEKIVIPYWLHISFIIWGILGIICVVTFFRKNEKWFLKDKRLGIFLQFVGRRTLDIYLLHYFFLPRHLDFLNPYILPNPILGFFVTLIMALMVLSLSLGTSAILRMSPFFAHYLFGVKKELR